MPIRSVQTVPHEPRVWRVGAKRRELWQLIISPDSRAGQNKYSGEVLQPALLARSPPLSSRFMPATAGRSGASAVQG